MTVHGAKGLEAPIVILADTTTPPKGRRSRACCAAGRECAPGTPDRLVWAGRKADEPRRSRRRARARVREAEDEYRRLLYVAMTRAADRLVSAASRGVRKRAGGLLVRAGRRRAQAGCDREAADDGDGTVWRWRKSGAAQAAGGATVDAGATPDSRNGCDRDAPPSRRRACRAPSTPRRDRTARSAGIGADRRALLRGAHRAPAAAGAAGHSAERRRAAARRYLARSARNSAMPSARPSSREVMAVLDDPRFAALFAPGSPRRGADRRPLARRRPRRVSGQVDRLAVTGRCRADRGLQDQPPGAARARRRAAAAMSRSWRSTARCSLGSIRTSRSAPPWSGPRCLAHGDSCRRCWMPRLRRVTPGVTRLDAPDRSSLRCGRPRGRCARAQDTTRYAMGVDKVSDATFEIRGAARRASRGGRFLGRMVRPVPDDRAGARRDRRLVGEQGQDRQAQCRREPGDGRRNTASCRSRR